ncbi:chemotaxis protein CheD [Nitrincola nitratireducens]|uniref:Probable chemoreceptor glutamine deamidase CheD n=1 Tax=Nitrincola nitratireducens TaxID=1229521 RepID=W9V831_9GAMM|nr:chemotaxis protein CheD [Nitrincola nitratireducens]EXJ12242.1 Chemoreceptor glutamine deamidase CheD [Nitrincola nitratireducens]
MSSYKKIVIHAGELVFGRGNKHIFTLLGSCISITLWHPVHRYSGMCHFALPRRPVGIPGKLDARYADDCIKIFKKAAEEKGTSLKEYECKVFGGGNMLHRYTDEKLPAELTDIERQNVGDSNAAEAFTQLISSGCQIKEADVGEFGYRRVWFNAYTGETRVEYTPVMKVNRVIV